MRFPFFVFFFLSSFLLMAGQSPAQDFESLAQTERSSPPIQDNSFLVEEAYNQEDGVIQHISMFEKLVNSHDWVYTQTDEWPVRSYRHQVSVTLAADHAGSFAGSGARWGDTAFNYRYQLVGSGETKLAVAPRLSVMFPTGDSGFRTRVRRDGPADQPANQHSAFGPPGMALECGHDVDSAHAE